VPAELAGFKTGIGDKPLECMILSWG